MLEIELYDIFGQGVREMLDKFKRLFAGIHFKQNEKRFYNYLSKNRVEAKSESDSIALIEFSTVFSNIIGLFFFLKQLRKKSNSTFVCYMIFPPKIWTDALLYKFKKIYSQLGVSGFFYAYPDNSLDLEIDKFLEKYPLKLTTKFDLENLEFEGVWVGDVIYDSYLYKYTLPTVELDSKELLLEIREALYYFIFWKKYFENHKVSSLIVSHTVYTHFTIVSRLAISLGVEVFQVNDSGLYRLNSRQRHAYHEFFDFKKLFNNLPADIAELGKSWAKKRLEKRFSGEVGVDMHYSTKSAWTDKSRCELIVPSDRKKIFVALHCFFDSPHPYGLNLFPDFYEWLDFLGKLSEKTNYDWYLKTHPDFLPGNREIVESFLKKYQKFNLIPATTSHHSVINSGIDFVLTVYGTVGAEYAYQGVPVINASLNNIHCAFDFNLHPKSIAEYESLLLNLDKVQFEIPKDQVLEYYFTKNYLCQQSWIWEDFDEMLKGIGGAGKQSTSNILDYFFKVYTPEFEAKALVNAEKFINSNDYSPLANTDKLKNQ